MNLPSYLTVPEADTYFANTLRSATWTSFSLADKTAAIFEATRLIENLNFTGEKADPDQALQFPRGDDTTIPDDINIACCEIAIMLLQERTPQGEVESLNMVSSGFGPARSTYDRSFALEHTRLGIPSYEAWLKLKPYLIDPKSITISRAN